MTFLGRPPRETAGLLVILALGAVLRHQNFLSLPEAPKHPVLFGTPWARPPLLDLLTPAGIDRHWVALVLGVLLLAVVAQLGRMALGAWGGLGVAATAAFSPALISAGSIWLPQSLVVVAVPLLAIVLHRTLKEPDAAVWPLVLVATLTLLSDWTAWSPVLAWLGWVTVFRPEWMGAGDARRATRGLVAGIAVAGPAYLLLLLQHPDLQEALGAHKLSMGRDAVEELLLAPAALWMGVSRSEPLLLRLGLSTLAVVAVIVGPQRAAKTGQRLWGSLLFAGTAGALVPLLAAHPWLGTGGDKNLWWMTPMVLCLAFAAVWPARRIPLVAALLLFGCTDADEDGHYAEVDDCDDAADTVHPGHAEWWDGIDNDCDGEVDASPDYLFPSEVEPNDATLGSCFAPEGQELRLADYGLLTRLSGEVSEVVDEAYDEGDLDCFALRVPDSVDRARLRVVLSWSDADSDLDVALWGIEEGEQAGFIQGSAPGAGPENHVSSGSFAGGEPLWLWIVGYSGPPTEYTVDLVLR